MHSQPCTKTFVHSESVLRHHPWEQDEALHKKCTAGSSFHIMCVVRSCSHVHESTTEAQTLETDLLFDSEQKS